MIRALLCLRLGPSPVSGSGQPAIDPPAEPGAAEVANAVIPSLERVELPPPPLRDHMRRGDAMVRALKCLPLMPSKHRPAWDSRLRTSLRKWKPPTLIVPPWRRSTCA